VEITRKRVNRGVPSYLLKIGGYVIRHPDFDDKHPALFKKDGVCKNKKFNKLSNSTHFRFVKITTQDSEKT
jgi:hypothetical protein